MTTDQVTLMQFLASLINQKGCRFASFLYRSKESGELARHTVLLGFDYRNALVKSKEQLGAIVCDLSGIDKEAAESLLVSFDKSLAGNNDAYTKAEIYQDTPITGLKLNSNDNSLQLFGLQESKQIIEPGTYKQVNSRPLTLAKEKLRKQLPIGKFREFAIDKGALMCAKLNGETLEF